MLCACTLQNFKSFRFLGSITMIANLNCVCSTKLSCFRKRIFKKLRILCELFFWNAFPVPWTNARIWQIEKLEKTLKKISQRSWKKKNAENSLWKIDLHLSCLPIIGSGRKKTNKYYMLKWSQAHKRISRWKKLNNRIKKREDLKNHYNP